MPLKPMANHDCEYLHIYDDDDEVSADRIFEVDVITTF